jgi:GlpG protein
MAALLTRFEREVAAVTLRDVLSANGVASRVERTDRGFEVWVEERDLARARELLVGVGRGRLEGHHRHHRRREGRSYEAARKRHARLERGIRMGPVTIALLAISLVVTFYTDFGVGDHAGPFHFAKITTAGRHVLDVDGWAFMSEPWRLITPIFIHGSLIHIFFNGWWIKDLGGIFETLFGSVRFLVFTLLVGALSNAGEFFIGHTPLFGGLSGLLYGLFGYLWIRGRFDPTFPVRLRGAVVIMLLGWFVVCAVGLIPNVANWAHGIGLLLGMIWGYLESGHLTRRLR